MIVVFQHVVSGVSYRDAVLLTREAALGAFPEAVGFTVREVQAIQLRNQWKPEYQYTITMGVDLQ